jgi:hypothetical protein
MHGFGGFCPLHPSGMVPEQRGSEGRNREVSKEYITMAAHMCHCPSTATRVGVTLLQARPDTLDFEVEV